MPDASAAAVPLYWYRPRRALPATAGMHRFTWDVHYHPLPGGGGGRGGLPIAAVPYNTAPPAQCAVGRARRLHGEAHRRRQELHAAHHREDGSQSADSAAALQQQATLSRQLYDGAVSAQATVEQLRGLREQADAAAAKTTDPAAKTAIDAFVKEVVALGGAAPAAGGGRGGAAGGRGGAGAAAPDSFANIGASLSSLITLLQAADAQPTGAAVTAVTERLAALAKLSAQLTALKTTDLAAVNAALAKAGQPAIVIR